MTKLTVEDLQRLSFGDLSDDDEVVVIDKSDKTMSANGTFKYLGKWKEIATEWAGEFRPEGANY